MANIPPSTLLSQDLVPDTHFRQGGPVTPGQLYLFRFPSQWRIGHDLAMVAWKQSNILVTTLPYLASVDVPHRTDLFLVVWISGKLMDEQQSLSECTTKRLLEIHFRQPSLWRWRRIDWLTSSDIVWNWNGIKKKILLTEEWHLHIHCYWRKTCLLKITDLFMIFKLILVIKCRICLVLTNWYGY